MKQIKLKYILVHDELIMPQEIIKAFNPFSIRHPKILRKEGHKPTVKTNATKLLVSFA